MIEFIQWATLAACGLVAAARVPSALRGENRSLFYIFFLMTLATLLSIPGPYTAIDRALGGMNYSNLVLRFIIFAAIYFVGVRVTRGFGAQDAYRLITGRVGMLVLLVVSLVLVAVFLLMDTSGSSAGMVAQAHKDARNATLVEYYGAAGRAYPAYVSLVLLPAMARAVRRRLPVLVRIAAFLLGTGGVAIALTLLFPLVPAELNPLKYLVNYTAVLCYVLGLALIWAAKVVNRRQAGATTSTEK